MSLEHGLELVLEAAIERHLISIKWIGIKRGSRTESYRKLRLSRRPNEGVEQRLAGRSTQLALACSLPFAVCPETFSLYMFGFPSCRAANAVLLLV